MTEEKEVKPSYKISRGNGILTAVLMPIGLLAYIVAYKGPGGSVFFGGLAGTVFAFVAIPAMFSYLVWALRGRKEKAGTSTYAIVLFLAVSGQILNALEQMSQDRAVEDMQADVRNLGQELDFANEEELEQFSDKRYETVHEHLDKISATSKGAEKKFLEVLKQHSVNEQAQVQKWESAVDLVHDPKILDAAYLMAPEDFSHQRQVLVDYRDETADYKAYYNNQAEILTQSMRSAGLSQSMIKGAIAGLDHNMSAVGPAFRRHMDAHAEYSQIMIEWVDLLEANQAGWRVTNDELNITDPVLQVNYDLLWDRLVDAEEEVTLSHEQLTAAMAQLLQNSGKNQ